MKKCGICNSPLNTMDQDGDWKYSKKHDVVICKYHDEDDYTQCVGCNELIRNEVIGIYNICGLCKEDGIKI